MFADLNLTAKFAAFHLPTDFSSVAPGELKMLFHRRNRVEECLRRGGLTFLSMQVAKEVAKPKRKGRWGLKFMGVGAVVAGGFYAFDAALHPRPAREIVQVSLTPKP